jgi:hypothetical protein
MQEDFELELINPDTSETAEDVEEPTPEEEPEFRFSIWEHPLGMEEHKSKIEQLIISQIVAMHHEWTIARRSTGVTKMSVTMSANVWPSMVLDEEKIRKFTCDERTTLSLFKSILHKTTITSVKREEPDFSVQRDALYCKYIIGLQRTLKMDMERDAKVAQTNQKKQRTKNQNMKRKSKPSATKNNTKKNKLSTKSKDIPVLPEYHVSKRSKTTDHEDDSDSDPFVPSSSDDEPSQ